jgi:hypothetical protein
MPHSLSRCCPGETLVSSLSGGPFQRLGTGWRAFPLLNLPVHRPPRPDPLLRYFDQHPYAKNRSVRTVTTYLIVVGRPTPSFAPSAPPWRRHPGRPRGVPGRPARPPASAFHNALKILYGWLTEEERSHQPDPVGRLVTPHGRTSWCSGGLEPPAFGFARRRFVPDLQGQAVVRINDDHLLDGRRRHYTADQIRAGCTPATARPRLALRHHCQ